MATNNVDSDTNVKTTQNSELGDCRKELLDLIQKKHDLELNLISLEKQIYKFEESYLDETQAFGNVIKGWDNYLTSNLKSSGSSQKADRKVKKWKDSDRLFSKSSVTYEYALRAPTATPQGKENRFLDDSILGRKIDISSQLSLTPTGSPYNKSSKKSLKRISK
ncbi:hypothetical protein LOD99_15020 [Oopsacas minuta]|uniref:Chromatin modification-related protein MEAF6 n=1 Tax=Oopsacas minuta TaxID=111878 RepID=A0AAV7KFH4_9METZ|nr:hypothetical protein LOD99_15020 [Oopsacas minuta]